VALYELGGAARAVDELGIAEDAAGLGQPGDGQPIVARQHFVVEAGAHALAAFRPLHYSRAARPSSGARIARGARRRARPSSPP